jgi:hypothetical protein
MSETNLFWSRGTQNNGVFRTDEYFVLDAHSEAVEVFGELRIGRDGDTFEDGSRHGIGADASASRAESNVSGSMVMTIPSFNLAYTPHLKLG